MLNTLHKSERLDKKKVIDKMFSGGARSFSVFPLRVVYLPVEELEAFMEHASKERLLIFYCQHGNASVQEGCRYVKRGFRICSVAGGMDAYQF